MSHTCNTESLCQKIIAADALISPYIRETPLEYSPRLSRMTGARVYLKMENLQLSASFKIRGAAAKLLMLSAEERQRGPVTASSGNHAAAFSLMCQKLGIQGTIFVPAAISRVKYENLRSAAVDLTVTGDDCVEAETAARRTAADAGRPFISPYNDLDVIAGQGTMALELCEQSGHIDAVFIPVGGGGLLSGAGSWLKRQNEHIDIIGCQPVNSAVMAASLAAGTIVRQEPLPTMADGTAGGIEPDSVTFELCRQLADDFILVSEDGIREALRLIIETHSVLAEGAAVLSAAALLKERARFEGKTVVLIISGARISGSTLADVFSLTGKERPAGHQSPSKEE